MYDKELGNIKSSIMISYISDLIKEVQAMESYDAKNKEYLHYIMAPEGMWIDIVSSVEPIITVQEHGSGTDFV